MATEELVASALAAPRRFGGDWITPSDPRYEELRWINDRRYDRRPAVIARPRGVADVQAAVVAAREAGLPLTVRSGGHGFSGAAVADDAVMIDLRLMDDVHVDLARRSVRIRPGALSGNLIRETAPYGLGPVTGMISEIGYGGIALRGGIGYRGPRYGFTCDNLLSVDVVLADGSWVTASPVANPELFWALRGAADNLGVVTSFEALLYPIPADVAVITMLWDPTGAEAAVRKFMEIEPLISDDLYWSMDAFFYEPGRVGIGLDAFHLGAPDVRKRELAMLEALGDFGTLVKSRVVTVDYLDLYELPLHGADWKSTSRVYFTSACVSDFGDDVTELFIENAHAMQAQAGDAAWEHRLMAVYPYDKGLSRPPASPSVHNSRTGLMLLPGAYYSDADEDLGHQQWCEDTAEQFARAGLTLGGKNAHMLHVPTQLSAQAVRESFGENYDRLLEIKAKYDPDNVFKGSLSATDAELRAPR